MGYLKSKVPIRSKKGFSLARKKMGVGKKTKEWSAIRAELKKRFEAAGITRCEICGRNNFLSLAHRKKRRNCDREEIYKCALLCIPCHAVVEGKSHEEMFNIINCIINKRKVQP